MFGAQHANDLLDPRVVRDAWSRFSKGGDELALQIWTVLMFRAWQKRWINQA